MPLGMRYMILSAFGFASMSVCVKLASSQSIPVLEIVAARALVSLVLSYISVRRNKLSPFGNKRVLLLARGLVGASALVCVYYSITHLPLAEATVLQYLHPMFTAVLAVIFLKERLKAPVLLCILLSFVGLILVAKPEILFGLSSENLPGFAVIIAMLGAFGSAIAYVLVRKLNETEDPAVIILYFPLVALPLSILLLWDDFVVPDFETTLILILVGIFTQVGQIGLTKSMQTETASRATSFSYLQVVFAAVFGWLIFSETPDLLVCLGAGFILLGSIVNVMFSKR